ncbi:MAG: hypothetical protein D8M59_12680 [Planctomycetes bacterium]|nr:hypothetical protein [Planctomycetota bacterium]NOG53670.1 hypothetical protein [Planctomycetota bacterium]
MEKALIQQSPLTLFASAFFVATGTLVCLSAPGEGAEPPKSQATTASDPATTAGTADRPPTDRERAVRIAQQGEPEYALRLVSDMAGDDDLLALRRSWYRQALEQRLTDREEGAVAELLLNPPPGCENDRAEAAVQLAAIWRADPETTTRELARRLRWYERLQASIQPAPMSPDFPIKLMLLALDSANPVTDPETRLGLLPLAEQISPNDPLWSGYYFNEHELLEGARTLEVKGEYLKAFEIYRQLIYRMRDKASWFQRQLVLAQQERMMLLEKTAGVNAALQAGTLVRKEFFNPEQAQRFRLYQEDLRAKLGAYRTTRILPHTVNGDLLVESSPITYLLRDELHIQKGGSVSVGPGVIIQNGRIYLSGGRLNLNGTAEYPVKLIGVTIVSDDVQGGGAINGQYTQFRDCRWVRANPQQSIPWATEVELSNTFSTNCQWRLDRHVKLRWYDSEFAKCDITYARAISDMPRVQISDINEPQQTAAPIPRIDALQWARSESDGFRVCRFLDCRVDDVVAIGMASCAYIDCVLTTLQSPAIHSAQPMTAVIGNYYEPAGQMAYWVNQQVPFDEDTGGPYVFEDAEDSSALDLGQADYWID